MQENKTAVQFLKRRSILIAGLVIMIIMLAGTAALNLSNNKARNTNSGIPTFVVKQGPLRINIVESGTIKAREQVIIKSQVEGRTTILSLIPEGTLVKKGDLLVELDTSELLDDKIDQEIRVQNAEASFVRASENLAVVKNQAQSDNDKAVLTLEFAKQDLKKYQEGEYPNKLKETEARITLAEEELQRAEEDLKWSEKLYEEQYLSQTELQADKLAANKKKLDLELAMNNLELLKEFTYKRDLSQLESDVKQAEMALERTSRKAKADVIQAEADLRAKESEYKRQQDKLNKLGEQIAKARVLAPADGLVIYATSAQMGGWRHNREPLEEGQEVREREELIYLPTALSMKAEVKIHESSMKKVKLNLPARITVDALVGKVFSGRVEKIAPLPDPQSMWLNPDLKVYNTEIYINEEGGGLRTGMSCKSEIIIEEYENAVYIPLQAIVRVKGKPTVYVVTDKTTEPRVVEIGLDNNRMVRIISGLQAGELVLLAPPLAAGTMQESFENVLPEIETGQAEMTSQGRSERRQDAGNIEDKSEESDSRGREFDPAKMTDEQRQKMREKFENMSPEEREKARRQSGRPRRRQDTGDQ